jgi:hypothetical protein
VKKCEECLAEVGDWTVFCHQCGALSTETLAKIIGVGLVATMALGAGIWK